MRILSRSLVLALAFAGAAVPLPAQSGQLPMESVPLDDLDAFRPVDSNWRVVGGVLAERGREGRLATTPGTGVLVNLPSRGDRDHLFTDWEHGDLELELDYLMPEGSNSGVYLQGRYEVQLLDSWGEDEPTFADAGGIYQRWDPSRGRGREGYEGRPPRVNASRAPGLWQKLRIRFQAPRFDAQGNKIGNARFVRVEHNGVVIHENVEVTGPTRSAAFDDERPTGPLMIQGDHGPVALRDIRYKRYSGERLHISDLRYRVYEGEFASLPEVSGLAPVREGAAEGIASTVAGVEDKYAVAFEGTMHVPTAGRYLFDARLDWVDDDPHFTGKTVGGARLAVGGREVLLHRGEDPDASAVVELPAGDHPFTLTYFKNRPWTNRNGIFLFAEGPGIEQHALHAESLLRRPPPPSPVTVQPEQKAVVLRSFVRHGDDKRTHVASVADPAGVHYAFDLERGALLHAWRGPFVETTTMWSNRGNDQVAEPLGSLLTLSGDPALARLSAPGAAWPDSLEGFAFRGYAVDEVGRPTFRYAAEGVEVEDRLLPAADDNALRRELVVRAPQGTRDLYVKLAEAEQIRRLRDGSYVVGDLAYYVVPDRRAGRPEVREVGGRQELVVPLRLRDGTGRVSYSIIW